MWEYFHYHSAHSAKALYRRNVRTLKKQESLRDGFELPDWPKLENINWKLKNFVLVSLLVNDQSKSLKFKSPKCKTMGNFYEIDISLWNNNFLYLVLQLECTPQNRYFIVFCMKIGNSKIYFKYCPLKKEPFPICSNFVVAHTLWGSVILLFH